MFCTLCFCNAIKIVIQVSFFDTMLRHLMHYIFHARYFLMCTFYDTNFSLFTFLPTNYWLLKRNIFWMRLLLTQWLHCCCMFKEDDNMLIDAFAFRGQNYTFLITMAHECVNKITYILPLVENKRVELFWAEYMFIVHPSILSSKRQASR